MRGERAGWRINDLRRWISSERLQPYVVACGGGEYRAVSLYAWNAAVAAALFEELGHFEVILRNALHEQLTAWHRQRGRPGEWYDDPAKVLDERRWEDIALARQRIARRGFRESPGRVVAELNLGFWRFLFDHRHQQILWAQALHRAFPGMPVRRRTEIQRRINRLHLMRNRIAHHEPVHREDLPAIRREITDMVSWISPDAAVWLTTTCDRLPTLLARRP